MADNTTNSAESLVEQGLQLYSQGRLDEAIARWREVIGQVPEHPRARDYIKYVEDNRAALEASFKLTSASSASLEAAPPDADESTAEETAEETAANVELVVSRAADSAAVGQAIRALEEGDPRWTLPLPGLEPVESTARMDVFDLQSKVDLTKAQAATGPCPTPAVDSPVVREVERSRRPTPLVLVPGEGMRREDGFEPQENTPVAVGLPQPSRVMAGQVGREEDEEHEFGELQKTPVILPPDLFEELAPPARAAGEGAERVESMLAGARQLHDQGTYEGSLWLCERVISIDASNVDARELLGTNRKVLLEQSRKQIGDLEQVPVIQIPQHEIMWHKLDHRAGFLLSRIDGQLSFEDIIDVSGMGEFEASRILSQLLNLGVIGRRG